MISSRAVKYCVFVFLLFPMTAFADSWQQYSDVMSRYYHLDQQAFDQIICGIEAEPLQSALSEMRKQLVGMPDKLRVTDTLDRYQLIFDKHDGLLFVDPSMNIDILSEKDMADPSRVRKSIGEMIHGFDQQVQGGDAQLKGLFEGYQTTKRGDIAIDDIEVTSDGAVVKYKKDGGTVTDTIRGADIHTVQSLPTMSVTVDSSYKPFNGSKLVLDEFDMKMDQPLQPVSIHGSVKYQSISGIVFPEEIDEHGVAGNAQSVQTTFVMTFKFTGCRLSKK